MTECNKSHNGLTAVSDAEVNYAPISLRIVAAVQGGPSLRCT